MGEGFSPAFDDREPEEVELVRTPDGDINNCGLASVGDESKCQMCHGICPDRQRLIGLGRFFAKKPGGHRSNDDVRAMDDESFVVQMEYALENCGFANPNDNTENVDGFYAPELLKRFKLAAREARNLAEALGAIREALGQKETHYLVMANDVAILVKALEWYALKTTMSLGASLGEHAQVALALVRQQTETTTCEACDKKIVVLESESDDVPATFCGECGGGRASVPLDELVPE
jgi:hypothetical protein